MALEVATYINGLNPANPAGSDPLAQADDHFRLIKTTLKNTFPNIDGPVTLTDDQINALETRIDALETGGVGGGTGGTTIVATLPATGEYIGQTVYNEADGLMYVWDGTTWVAVTFEVTTPDAPAAIALVDTLPTTATDGDVVFNRTDNKLYERVNGAWVEVTMTVNAAQEVADASITTAKFAQGIRPIEIVDTLPTTNNSEGRLVYLTTDDKIYRYTGAAWTSGVSTGDLTGTIGADQIAANAITAGKIQAGAIGADQIAAGAISTAKLAAGAITADKIAATAITADKIATNAITSDKIAANTITAGKIAAAAIGTTQLAAAAITSDKISSGSITTVALASGAVTATKIAAGSITAASGIIANAAVGTLQIAGNSVTQAVAVHVAAQQAIPDYQPTWKTVASQVVTVSGTQPILVSAQMGTPGSQEGTSTNYDEFVNGMYWKYNTQDTECVIQFVLGTTASGQVMSTSVTAVRTESTSAAYLFTGITAGTYTLAVQVARANSSVIPFAVRDVTMTMLETKR